MREKECEGERECGCERERDMVYVYASSFGRSYSMRG